MFFPISTVSRPLRCHLEELCKLNNISRYRRLSSIPLHSFALLGNSKRSSLILSTAFAYNNPVYANKFQRSFAQQNLSSVPLTDSAKKGSSKVKLLTVGFGLGAVIGFGYFYNKNFRHKSGPIANLDSDDKLFLSESPPIDFIAKKVQIKNVLIIWPLLKKYNFSGFGL